MNATTQQLKYLRNAQKVSQFQQLWASASMEEKKWLFDQSMPAKFHQWWPMMAPDMTKDDLQNTLQSAAYGNHVDMVKFLVEHEKCDPSQKCGLAFFSACHLGHIDLVNYLLPLMSDEICEEGMVAAAAFDHPQSLALLVDRLGAAHCHQVLMQSDGDDESHQNAVDVLNRVVAQQQQSILTQNVQHVGIGVVPKKM